MRRTLRKIAVYLVAWSLTVLLGISYVYCFVTGIIMTYLGFLELRYFKMQFPLKVHAINGAVLLMGAGLILILLTMLFAVYVTPKLDGWIKRNRD